jgi:integrase
MNQTFQNNLHGVYSSRNRTKGGDAMYMRLINGRWYSNIRDKKNPKKKIQVSLDAYENETRKATKNLGVVLSDIEKGINPTSARKNIHKLELSGKVTERTKSALRKHIYPFFGAYKPREIDKSKIEIYIKHRFGLNADGELQAYKNTIEKELLALQRLMQTVYGEGYKLPKVVYKKLNKEILSPLTLEQIEVVSRCVMDMYKPVYWIMAYTGMDVSDVISLTPGDFQDGWIKKERGKSGIEIAVPVCEPLEDILKSVPWPIHQDARIFQNMTANGCAIHVRRCFKTAGLDGYGSKYLRRFIASIMLDNGYSNDWIGKALAHAEGSNVTKKYTKVYESTLKEAFGKIKSGVKMG